MHLELKQFARNKLPPGPLNELRWIRASLAAFRARRAFQATAATPTWLPAVKMDELQRRYNREWRYYYDPDSLAKRGHERARRLMTYLPATRARTLELACHDGMVSLELARLGMSATALDLSGDHLDERAK